LIIGCGCRGRLLALRLRRAGHAVRGTTRKRAAIAAIEAAGAEAVLGDPDRVATLVPAFEHVSVACILLGSAGGTSAELAALHGSRLEMLLGRMLDTTVRGVLYEARGSTGRALLAAGARQVSAACEDARIPYVLLDADPTEPSAWLQAAEAGVSTLLS
jgi:3-hydroxyisobutyrate dehydrogenase-like beta-hydroxyacid dehydrogenase